MDSEFKQKTPISKKIKQYQKTFHKMEKEIEKVIVGQKHIIRSVFLSLMADGHLLLESVPGLAKSLLVETVAKCIKNATFRRIQFVPDMLPADILGMNVFNPKTGEFYIVKGPIFANIILADEINRAPPKTQAALMEVMQEKKVNIQKEEFKLDKPFLVLATQNPIEQYGTYPLPEAIVDRFFMKIIMDYPLPDEEYEIIDKNTMVKRDITEEVKPVVTKKEILQIQEDVRKIYISPKLKRYIIDIVNTTRGRSDYKISSLKYVRYGGSPRASILLGLASRAYALLQGRDFVIPTDIKAIAKDVLRHRIILNYEGKASGITTDEIVEEILDKVEII